MGEDLSSSIRVGITVVLLAALIVSVTNIYVVVGTVYDEYIDDYSEAMSDPTASSLLALNGVASVGAPTVYKMLERIIDAIPPGCLNITWADGTTTSDYMALLNNAWKNVKVTVFRGINGSFQVDIVEVTK